MDVLLIFIAVYLVIGLIWLGVNLKFGSPLSHFWLAVIAVLAVFGWLPGYLEPLTTAGVDYGGIQAVVWVMLSLGGLFWISPVRKIWLTQPFFSLMKKTLPPIGQTEMIALKAGDVWWDKELFSSNPDWSVLDKTPLVKLSPEEQDFLDNKVPALCALVNAYQVRNQQDLPKEAWDYIKENQFLGMMIPKSYGGLGFSHTAHSLIITALSSRSGALGVSVMVPNSLGPGELLHKYGTQDQKDSYLKRLATGEEIPCFALTSTYAGSDAGGIIDRGIVCVQEFEGQKTLGFLLNWEKRYITLAPIATLVGLAFKAYDPDNLLPSPHPLSGQADLGITCALIPRDTVGVEIGKRHNPLGSAFMNGPIFGKDVFIPMHYIIGDSPMIGQGWQMLMASLSIGRGISLPATANAGTQHTLLTSSAYANSREQFGIVVAKFEGVAEKLGNMVVNAYRTKANCIQTTNALDTGIVPATISAIVKYRNTEIARNSINAAMDIHGGRAVMAGEKNYILEGYLNMPVGITVEGANILTRTLMVFGQGVTRCHPFLFSEIEALYHPDHKQGLADFHQILSKHLSFSVRSLAKLEAMRFGFKPSVNYGSKHTQPFYKKIATASIQFATIADLSLLIIGGNLKRKEMVSGQFADSLSALYEATAALRYYDESSKKDEKMLLVMRATIVQLLFEFEQALTAVIRNLPLYGWLKSSIGWLVFGLGTQNKPLPDRTILKLSGLTSDIDWIKSNLAPDVYLSQDKTDAIRILLDGHTAHKQQQAIVNKIKQLGIKYQASEPFEAFVADLVNNKTLSQKEANTWLDCRVKIFTAMSVDAFDPEQIINAKI